MSKFNPEKLTVEFMDNVNVTEPVIPRRYTLTHSDITAELFLTIGADYAYDKLNAMRDEVLGEWVNVEDTMHYNVYLQVDGEDGQGREQIRDAIFRRELPLALQAIRYGDRKFFKAHPEMDYHPIIVYFISTDPEYNKAEYWGTFADYHYS
jgi:hypothetical protein